ncbi:sulfite exporter TauE/SafE family protein [Kiloniella majae]|uniref:sulfite exporter TauE/SafE family protein n=1 Tax=Kiloniella majae TaxID=1938558 RepID=UPI000A27881A|nr:sulfite exporter TauE/SafE family protein [Kiloniella majae]
MHDLSDIPLIFAVFFLAGLIKGIIGLGLPTVSLGLLTIFLDLPSAMVLLLVPSFVTNVWQALSGGKCIELLKRLWPFMLFASFFVGFGGLAITHVESDILTSLLGVLLILYSLSSLCGFRISLSRKQKIWCGPLIGAVNGILTGMTGSFVMPGVIYLQGIGLSRDMLVQAMGILFSLSTLALGITLAVLSLEGYNLLRTELGMQSFVALLPAAIGMMIGQKIRHQLSENSFRQFFFISLLILGCSIILRTQFFNHLP